MHLHIFQVYQELVNIYNFVLFPQLLNIYTKLSCSNNSSLYVRLKWPFASQPVPQSDILFPA